MLLFSGVSPCLDRIECCLGRRWRLDTLLARSKWILTPLMLRSTKIRVDLDTPFGKIHFFIPTWTRGAVVSLRDAPLDKITFGCFYHSTFRIVPSLSSCRMVVHATALTLTQESREKAAIWSAKKLCHPPPYNVCSAKGAFVIGCFGQPTITA